MENPTIMFLNTQRNKSYRINNMENPTIMFLNTQRNKSYINNMENPTIIYYNITKTTDLRNEWVVIVIGNDFFTPYNDIYIINTIYISYYVVSYMITYFLYHSIHLDLFLVILDELPKNIYKMPI